MTTPLKIAIWSVKVYFDPIVGDKTNFVAPVFIYSRPFNMPCQ